MRRFSAIILLLLITCQTFYRVGVVGYWVVNQKYIAETLCENRANPRSCCAGKCVLNKQLQKDGEQSPANQQSKAPQMSKFMESEVFIPSQFTISTPQPDEGSPVAGNIYGGFYKHFIPSDHLTSVFHPPDYAI